MNFFRIFGADLRLGKNTLKTIGNVDFRMVTSENRGSSQGFHHNEVIIYVKKLYPVKFLGNLKLSEKGYVIGLRMQKKNVSPNATTCNLVTSILKFFEKLFQLPITECI